MILNETRASARATTSSAGVDLTVLILEEESGVPLATVQGAVRQALESLAVASEVIVYSRSQPGARGYGQAFRDGIAASRGDYVVVVDGDFVSDPAVLPRLWHARGDAGVVIASRYVAGGCARMPAIRRIMSRALNAFSRRGLSLAVRDSSSSCRLYRRDALRSVELGATDVDVLQEALIRINADGWDICEVPFRYASNLRWPSSQRPLRFARIFLRTFLRMWRLRNSAFSADYDERAFNSVIPLQRYWQRTRHRRIMGLLDGQGPRTLDIGCGSSRIIQGLPYAVGLDIQLKKLRRVQRKAHRVVQATITSLPFASGAFGTIICSQVIEHVPYELVDWREMNRVLVTGGALIVGTPDYATIAWPLLEWAYGIVHPAGYVHEHINHYTAASLRAELDAHGFAVTDRAYVGGGELIYRAKKVRDLSAVAS